MPMLSNAYNGDFTPKGIEHIIHNKTKRATLIHRSADPMSETQVCWYQYRYRGTTDNNNEYFTSFVKEMSEAFHAHGLYVTQDVAIQ